MIAPVFATSPICLISCHVVPRPIVLHSVICTWYATIKARVYRQDCIPTVAFYLEVCATLSINRFC
ncbi:protein of unknown function [Candidatus Filomicrobium marinum]|uniref:Uncharacterized protein n=1 Tax=Candidatus Filomicrobium marinum TaxID=1608628 RepID=A0A0D6JFY9_9HYPH|nr:protein of unknown function [Candidatus Filomicrobium marinum]CPR19040.1 protein of unknown function [Candidatus Filomicrobium marinum]